MGGSHARPRRPGGERYAPPEASLIATPTVVELLDNRRSLTPSQEARLGLDMGVRAGRTIWCVGDTSLVQAPCVAIVGTRDVSPEGAARARRLARELAARGVVIVSGLARGVDTEALTAAIEAGGRVIAVIGTPVDKAYPAENGALQERIYREHLLVSPFAPGRRVFQSNFPERNKLMAALSDATVIIEAGETSGTLHQAAECVRLGRALLIAQNVMRDPALQWPAKFQPYPNVQALTVVDDVMRVLTPA